MEMDQAILSKLKGQARLLLAKRIMLLAAGAPLSLLGPLILGTIFWFAGWQFGLGASWSACFWVTSAVMVPLLLGLEARTGGNYLGEAVADSEGISSEEAMVIQAAGLDGMLFQIGRNPKASLAGLVEIFLTGPRMLISAWRDFRIGLRCRGARLARAAQIVGALYRSGAGLPPRKLLNAGEGLTDLLGPIAYLAYHQWIGVAASGDKLWLPGDVRGRLTAAVNG